MDYVCSRILTKIHDDLEANAPDMAVLDGPAVVKLLEADQKQARQLRDRSDTMRERLGYEAHLTPDDARYRAIRAALVAEKVAM